MSLNEEERKIMVDLEYSKATHLMGEAEKVISIELWNNAANRLYYALFHAVSALLIHEGMPVGTHKGTHLRFGKYFVQTGIFPSEAGRLYAQMETLRERADYNCYFEASKEDIEQFIIPAKEMMKKIKEIISR